MAFRMWRLSFFRESEQSAGPRKVEEQRGSREPVPSPEESPPALRDAPPIEQNRGPRKQQFTIGRIARKLTGNERKRIAVAPAVESEWAFAMAGAIIFWPRVFEGCYVPIGMGCAGFVVWAIDELYSTRGNKEPRSPRESTEHTGATPQPPS